VLIANQDQVSISERCDPHDRPMHECHRSDSKRC
jgi:hypothetical protein